MTPRDRADPDPGLHRPVRGPDPPGRRQTYVSRVLTELDLRDRVQAVIYAYRIGLAT